ncbi:MAG: YdbL family protein [Pseudomonadota bacterium]|nr:YdbL family protein [Pseudomonadota bacterium]MDQ3160447.1 YdbL family protein [Pseudomonadota bacterium]
MKQWMGMPVVGALLLSACVTINVYFPAAEAKAAAREFVEKVIDDADNTKIKESGGGGMAMHLERFDFDTSGFDPWILLGIGSARAQGAPDISIKTPAIQAIQSRMESRFNGTLRAGFDSGALGFTADGLISVRDAGKLELRDRVAMNAAVADDNRDRKAVYREVAVANSHPEWESQIRNVFAKQWVESAHSGWWYQSGGGWKQK